MTRRALPTPAEPRPATRIREALEQAIVLGEYAAGTRLDEHVLAARFAVSRTPVREALQQLVATGLIEHRRNRGSFVRAFDAIELLERFELMAELEAACGRFAAERADEDGLAVLERAVTLCEQAAEHGDMDHYYRQNSELHAQLYALSGNRFLEQQASELHRRLQAYRRLQLRVPRRVKESMAEHRELLAALRNGDPERAATVARRHVAVQGTRFRDLVAQLPALAP